ncbi:Transcription factor MYB106 [Glycine soja]
MKKNSELVANVEKHVHGNWCSVPAKKQKIYHTIKILHALGNNLSNTTNNEIKNCWNTNIKKKLMRKRIHSTTHKPKANRLYVHQSKDVITMKHLVQQESARFAAKPMELFHSPSSLDSLSTKQNNNVYIIYVLMLVTYYDLQLLISTLSFLGRKLIVSTNVGKLTNIESLLSYKSNGNVIESNSQTQKILKDYMLDL